MRAVLKKNLVAHKRKDRLTAIIYALSLGCIIFLLTSANLQISLIVDMTTNAGSDINIFGTITPTYYPSEPGKSTGIVRASAVDDVIRKYSNEIHDFGYFAEPTVDTSKATHEVTGSKKREPGAPIQLNDFALQC